MNIERIPGYARIAPRLKSWFNPTSVVPKFYRGVLMGTLISVIIGEISAYKLIQRNIKIGELNVLAADFVIMGISAVEAFVGPFVAWLGYKNRRLVILGWNVALILVSLTWLAMPAIPEIYQSQFCLIQPFNVPGVPDASKGAIRLSILTISCTVFMLTRVAVWCHGIAQLDEEVPEKTPMNFGILIMARVIALMAGDQMLSPVVENEIYLQVLALVGGTLGTIVQVFLFVPKPQPPVEVSEQEAEEEEFAPTPKRDFFSSVARVVQNTQALTIMAAIGLLAAALWGFAYNEDEIVKVSYHIDVRKSTVANITQMLRYLVIITSTIYVGVKLSAPILPEFCRFRGIKQAIVMSMVALVFYILLMTVGKCERGRVAGLDNNRYVNPNCSLPCNCIPRWRAFSPVCVTDQVTTYVSPCQAGCSSADVVDHIIVFTDCLCAPNNGRASMGACSHVDCSQSHQLHLTFFLLAAMATVLAFQAHGSILLRLVEPHDRSVALGVAGSIVALIAFVCGHSIFLGLNAASCRWFEDGRCHLQIHSYPILIASASGAMVIISIMISISILVYWKVAERSKRDELEDEPENRSLMDS